MSPENIIIFFCQQTNVDHSLIYRRDHNGKLWNTRYMIWHYLHCVKGLPTSKLCKMFNRNRPTIFRGIRIFREHFKYHKDIRERYNNIVKKLEGMAEATPSDNMEEK